MSRNIKYKFLALILVLLSSSCSKWLELEPQDGIVRENFWKTKEQLKSAVIGIYTSLINVPVDQAKNPSLVSNLFLWGELRADMVSPTVFALTSEIDFNNDEILSTNQLANWSTLYNTINFCNTVLEYGPAVIENDNTLTEQQLNAYLAEARGIRAYMYLVLLKTWGEVPLQLKASSSDSKIEQLAKSSKDAVFNQIISDLDFAAINAVNTYGNQNEDKGRITKYSIYALQADAYLWMDKYDECISACNKVISSNRFGLIDATNVSNWYRDLYINGNSNESIFEIQFDNQALNPWFLSLAQATRRFIASPIVPELYGSDPLDLTRFDIRGDAGSYRASDNALWKHVGTANIGTTVTATNSSKHWLVYRYADILLLKAEALAWTNKGQEALDLVNTVRTRAKALFITEENPSPTNAADVSEYIMRERAREFAFEGKRWYDLLRNAKRNNYARINLITEAILKVAATDKQQSIISKFRDTRSHYLPIALSELQADKLLVQNPFYQ